MDTANFFHSGHWLNTEIKQRNKIIKKTDPSIGIVVAMPQELQTLGSYKASPNTIIRYSERISIGLSGIGAQNAEQTTKKLLARDIKILISWGTATALTKDIKPGFVCIPAKVVTATREVIETDNILRNNITRLVSSFKDQLVTAPLCEAKSLLSGNKDKTELAKRSQAAVADMESAAIARLAKKHNIPFLAIRTISDSLDMSVPPSIGSNLKNGKVNIAGLLRQVLFKPQDWISLISLGYNFRKAKKSLHKLSLTILPYLNNLDNINFAKNF